MGCKGDLDDEREVSDDVLVQVTQRCQATYILTSSKDNVGVDEAFRLAAEAHLARQRLISAAEQGEPRRGRDPKQFFERTNSVLQ